MTPSVMGGFLDRRRQVADTQRRDVAHRASDRVRHVLDAARSPASACSLRIAA